MANRGMTLLEILVVVVLVGLLSTLAAPHIIEAFEGGRRDIALAKCKEIHGAIHVHRMRHPAEPPRRIEDLPGLDAAADPWGKPYRLDMDSPRIRVWSDGPDRSEGTDDDICYVPRDE